MNTPLCKSSKVILLSDVGRDSYGRETSKTSPDLSTYWSTNLRKDVEVPSICDKTRASHDDDDTSDGGTIGFGGGFGGFPTKVVVPTVAYHLK